MALTPISSGGSAPVIRSFNGQPAAPKENALPADQFVASQAVASETKQVATSTSGVHLCKSADCAAQQAIQGAPGGYLATTPEIKARMAALELRPQDVTHVLYHANCPDGFGARCAAEALLGDKAKYIPVSYEGGIPDLPKDAKVAIVDFSYPREQLLDLKSKVAGMVVLDHHKKAIDSLGGLDFAVFSMERAGAGLAWAYFHPDEPEPELYKYLEDHDLWKKKLDKTDEVSDAVASYPMDFKTWQGFDIEQLKQEGTTIERYKKILVKTIVDNAAMGEIDGHKVPIANSHPSLRSDVGHELLQKYPDAPFAGVYYMEGNKRMWSVRSRGDFDVNEIGKDFGGGGHPAASGFQDPAPPQPIVVNPPPK